MPPLAGLLLLAALARPLAPERVLTPADGLSGSIAQAVAVGADGFLWVGTQQRLDRWDGVRLRPFALRGGARALAAAPDGTLWAVGRESVGFVAPGADRLRHLRAAAFDGPSLAVALDPREGAWIGTAGRGLWHAVPARARIGRARGLPSDSVTALVLPR